MVRDPPALAPFPPPCPLPLPVADPDALVWPSPVPAEGALLVWYPTPSASPPEYVCFERSLKLEPEREKIKEMESFTIPSILIQF